MVSTHSYFVNFASHSVISNPVLIQILSQMILIILTLFLGLSICPSIASDESKLNYFDKDIKAFHFHTYIFDENKRQVEEAMTFRKNTRRRIQDGFLRGCSLNQVMRGTDGPHPFSQYELCCNKTYFASATAWHMQNHGNLSVLIHPLTREDLDDHKSRATWIGQAVPLDTECPFLYPFLPKPRPCPVYPYYPDELPPDNRRCQVKPIPGTEDYANCTPGFSILGGFY